MQKKENKFFPKKTNLQSASMVEINYEYFYDDKNIKTIVILHGRGGSSQSWLIVGEILKQNGFNIIIPDLPGFGKTKLNKVFDLEEYAIVIEEFLKKIIKNKKIILWGHSNGGAISIKITNRAKINIERLILNNSAGIRNDKKRGFKRKIFNKISKILKKMSLFSIFSFFGRKKIQKIREYFYRAIGAHDYLNAEKIPFLKQTYKNIIKEDIKEEIKKINIDTLLIWGEKDDYTPLSDGYFMRKNIKNSKMIILENQKHSIHLFNPEILVKNFLTNI